jgi:dihydropyrimidine dehydrogenase (NAD+) subunit PreA
VTAIELEYTHLDGALTSTGQTITIACDQVLTAIGQKLSILGHQCAEDRGRQDHGRPKAAPRDRRLGRRRLRARWRRPHRIGRRDGSRRRRIHQPRLDGVKGGMRTMADIRNNFVGIKSPNPFWLASAPPTDKAYNVERAFKAGWGGVVWKTLGEEGPPVVNVNGPRYGAIWGADRRLLGLNNIELITDRPLQINLQEMKQVKKNWPDRGADRLDHGALRGESWKAILPLVEETEADGIELNFGCPHGMSERGMGAAVGQVPEYIEMVVRWCKQYTRMPVITKLTPNITDVRRPPVAPRRRHRCRVADQHDQLDCVGRSRHFAPNPTIDGKGTHGGYCGPAVKPIALNMVAEIARDPETYGLPISGIGGITTWRDAAEFMALGAGNVQVCTAAMTYGFKIVQEMISGLSNWMDEKGHRTLDDVIGRAVPNVTDWQYLNLNYIAKARSTRTPASSAAAATSPARIPRTRRSPRRRRRAPLRGDGRRMRRLQSLRQRLPGR